MQYGLEHIDPRYTVRPGKEFICVILLHKKSVVAVSHVSKLVEHLKSLIMLNTLSY